jgi:hypothetical protein
VIIVDVHPEVFTRYKHIGRNREITYAPSVAMTVKPVKDSLADLFIVGDIIVLDSIPVDP